MIMMMIMMMMIIIIIIINYFSANLSQQLTNSRRIVYVKPQNNETVKSLCSSREQVGSRTLDIVFLLL
jgi:hypothetical protein